MKHELAATLSNPARLAALRDLNLLDTGAEEAFDRLSELASRILRTPVALVTLVDENRQFFKSCLGLPEPWASWRQTPLSHSFCQHVVASGEPLILSDAREHPVLRHNSAVSDLRVIAYLGIPLVTPEGHGLGSFCVIDAAPRTWTDDDVWILQQLAASVMTEIALRREIADRERAEKSIRQSEEKYRDLFENANDLIQSVDSQGRFLYVNRAWRETLGYDDSELASLSVFDILHAGSREHCLRVFQRVMAGEQADRVEAVFLRRDGRSIAVEGNVNARIADGAAVATRGIFRDVTERKRAENLLQARNEELKAFAYTVSHDLKAPLRGIAGYARELNLRHRAELGERALFCLDQITTAVRNLDRLIDDLLEYSRLGAEALTVTEINAPELVEDVLKDRSRAIAERGVEVTVAIPFSTVRGWRRGLRQALTNLIDNAIKFSLDRTPPRIRIEGVELEHAWRISVADNGAGFDMKHHDRIFGLFQRLPGAEVEGTGAGLAIARRLLDRQGGRIWAVSQPGHGTTFFVEWPKQPSRDATA